MGRRYDPLAVTCFECGAGIGGPCYDLRLSDEGAQQPIQRPHRTRLLDAERAGVEPQDRPHGTRSTYLRGCRCEPCVVANREYRREHDGRRTP